MPKRNLVLLCLIAIASLLAWAARDRGGRGRLYGEVTGHVGRMVLEPVDDEALFRGAMEGMFARLDEHSAFVSVEPGSIPASEPAAEFAGVGLELHPVARAVEPQDAGQPRRAGSGEIGPGEGDDEQIALPAELLRRGIGDRLVFRREHVRCRERQRAGQRNAEADRLSRDLESGRTAERGGQLRPPAIEAQIRRGRAAGCRNHHFGGQIGAFGHADLVGAGEPFGMDADRQAGSRNGIRRQGERNEDRIGILVDVVHQPGDDQRVRHRIAQRAGAGAGRQRPRQRQPEAGVAGV